MKMAARDRFADRRAPRGAAQPRSGPGRRAAGRSRGPGSAGRQATRPRGRGWRSTATRPTAPGRPAPPTATPGTTPSSSPGRCARPCPAGSPSTTSPSTRSTGTVTCPAGLTRPMSPARTVTFGAACAGCPLRERCTTAKDGRSMTIHPHDGPAARRPRPGPHRRVQAGLPHPVGHRAGHRLDRHPERPPHQAPLHRHRQERRLAAHPVRRDQPAHPAQGRADPPGRGLGPGLTGPDRLTSGPACCQAYRRSPIQGRAAARTVARTGEIIRQQGQSAPRQRPRHRLIQRAPRLVRPMLATLRHGLPADHDRYGWEFKWDGLRAIAYVSSDEVSLVSRNDKEMAARYPDLAVLASRVKAPVLDGEIVVLRGGRPDFGALQSRMHVRRPTARLVEGTPVQLYLFDLLHYDEESLLGLPYTKRRDRLEELGLDADPVRTPPWYRDGRGDRPGRQSRAWPGGGGRQAADLPLLSGQAPGLDQGQERPASGGRDLRVETR